MSRKTQQAAALAVAAMMVFTISGAAASGAFAQDPETEDRSRGEEIIEKTAAEPSAQAATEEANAPTVRFVSQEVVQQLPGAAGNDAGDEAGAVADASSLEELVAAMPATGELSKDMQCLAGAIYFEARGEPLLGQLAVGQVIINRAESESFPSSYCGVVYQRSQFSFVRGGRMPAIATSSSAWRKAKAVARIAHEGLWNSPAQDALYFHASYVKPNWRRTRVARVDSHIFYR